MTGLPTSTVTFLFTDIEGSTRLLKHLGDRYAEMLMEYLRLLRTSTEEWGGQGVGTQGDAFFAVFRRARDGLAAAVSAQRAIITHTWPEGTALRVRMGVHTGEALSTDAGYVGMDVHRAARICAAAHGAQILLSDTVYALVVKGLSKDLTLLDLGNHRLKDLAQPQRLFQAVAEGLPATFPPLRTLDSLPNNLPRQLTSFIGRERELVEIKQLVSSRSLLTLTGTGGSGKTRLALQVAADLLDQYPDGVWLVELASLPEPALVPKAVASALNVPEQPSRQLTETLAEYLGSTSVLLVLDNCEHLLNACAALADALLRRCPNLRILATSREALGITGELMYRVPSLSLPDPERLASPENLMRYEAARLFVERAVASNPEFRLTQSSARATAKICNRLDGIPLALELAAARVKALAAEQIAARLDDRFQLLTGGSRTGPLRHQTLRAAMDWSYDLLPPKERTVLIRLSVFAGGCTLEGAEAVCSGKGINENEVLDLLTQLVDKSLVKAQMLNGEMRYRMLETIRQYGQDRLLASGDAPEISKRHRAWYLGLAERAKAGIFGPEQLIWLNRLEGEHDNLRTALGSGTTESEDAETRLRLAEALVRFWDYHTHWREGRKWLETALAGSRDMKSATLTAALAGAGFMAYREEDYGSAMALYEESLTLARELRDDRGIAMALMGRGLVTMRRGDFGAAIAFFEEGLELSRKSEDTWLMAVILAQLGVVVRRKGEYAKAVSLCESSLALYRALGGKRGIAYSLRLAGHAVRLLGDLERAAGLYKESLALFEETGDKWVATECIDGLALIASAHGNHERAACLFGIVEAARETFRITMPRPERGDHERFGTTSRDGQGDEVFATARAEGRAMTLEQAIEYALEGAK